MTWLFSKAMMEDYANSLSSPEQAEEFSGASSLDGEPFAQLNVKPTPHKFWRSDKMMEHSDLSRFGLTLRLLTEGHGEVVLTSYLAAFPVKTLAPAGKVQGSAENAQDFGEKWSGLFAKLDRDTSSWRTPQLSLLEDWTLYSQTWPRSGSMRNGMCFQRPTLAPTMNGNASGLLPTPTKSWAHRGPGLSNNMDNLRMSLGATQATLAIVKEVGWRWPPSFVEWMMGWPIQWTALQPLETAKFHEWQRQHGGFLRHEP